MRLGTPLLSPLDAEDKPLLLAILALLFAFIGVADAVALPLVVGAFLAGVERGVSYLLAGDGEIDLPLVLEKIRACLGVRTLSLSAAVASNGAFCAWGSSTS